MPDDYQPDKAVIQTFVHYKDLCFLVSTIERSCSAAASYGQRYNETLVWGWDVKEGMRNSAILCTEDDSTGSINTHQRVVNRIFSTGNP